MAFVLSYEEMPWEGKNELVDRGYVNVKHILKLKIRMFNVLHNETQVKFARVQIYNTAWPNSFRRNGMEIL